MPLCEVPRAHHDQLGAAHAMTRAAWDLALWRRDGITPWDEVLEPVVAAARGGAGGLAPFPPVSGGHRYDRPAAQEGEAFAAARLIQVLTRFPIVPAELVTREAPCSPMSARRNLNLFTERGLAREITGQGRYRFWTAAL